MGNSNRINRNDFAILIVSYDGAKELWQPFSQAWQKFWPDCKFKIVLINQNETLSFDNCFSKVISIPSEKTEAVYRIREALKQIDSKYVMVMCDDYFLCKEPDEKALVEILNIMKAQHISCTHMSNSKRYDGIIKLRNVKSDSFLVSGGIPSIYEKDFLYKLCEKFKNCSMRQWEINASKYLKNKNVNIKIVENSTFECYHCVLEGYWRWRPYIWARENRFNIGLETYNKPEIIHSLRSVIKAVCFNIVLYCMPHLYKKWTDKKYSV
jgi:hypothetical protein